jgi:hypothetical protein
VKRTATLIEQQADGQWLPKGKITCKVIGEMEHGEKVWEDIETGEQYWLARLNGQYMFFKG